jgi:hypothetical protein
MRAFNFPGLFCCVALLPSAVLPATLAAQTIDRAGADALEAQLPAVIDTLLQSAPEVRYSFEGQVQALPSGDAYSLAIPQARFDFGGQAIATVPAFTANVTPLDNGWNQAQWDFPQSITVVNPRRPGQEVTITFTSNDNSMTIAPQYAMALQADYGFEDVSVTVKDQRGELTIATLELTADTQSSGAGPDSYDSESRFVMRDFAVDVPAENVRISLDSFDMGGTTHRQRLDLFAGLQHALDGLDPESETFAAAFLDVLRVNAGEKWLGAATFDATVEGVSFRADEGSGTVGLLQMMMEADGLDQNAAQLAFGFTAQDITSPQAPAQFASIAPTVTNLELVATDVPLEALSQEIYAVLGDAPSEEELFGPKGRRAGVGDPFSGLQNVDPMVFVGLLLNSGALVELQSLYLEAPIGYIAAQGVIDPDPQAAFQAVAELKLDIAGLPEMISFAQQMGGDAAQAAAMATALAAMGRDGTDQDGVAIKEFDLEVTASGQILLNGNDMSAMMGMFQ